MHPKNFKVRKIMNSRRSRFAPKSLLALFLALGTTLVLAESTDWRAPPAAANRPNPLAGNANATALGEKLYVANCLTCHGPSGKGDGPGGAALEKKPADLGARIKAGE